MSKSEEFRDKLKVEREDSSNKSTKPKMEDNLDMIYTPKIILIDDDTSICQDIQRRLPSVSCEVISIDNIVRYISRGIARKIFKS